MINLFLSNKYTKWYYDIINNALSREIDTYTEKHHIIPRCLGGKNNKENLVRLTAREHFICHRLLVKMADNKKHQYQLWNAFSCMLYRENGNQERYTISSREFDNIKKIGASIKSARFSGENNPQYGKKGPLSHLYGKNQSQEHKNNRLKSFMSKDQSRTLESRKKQSASTKNVPKKEEHKKNISLGLLGNQNNLDKTIYIWLNTQDKSVIKMTRREFSKFVGCKEHTAAALIKDQQKCHKYWIVIKEIENS